MTTDSAATKITGIDLVGYLTSDPERAVAFYRDVMGIAPTNVDDAGRGAEFTLADGSTFGVWKPDAAGSGGFVMFKVADARAAVESFRARGAQLGDVQETPVCFMAFGADPDGNAICVHQRK